SLAQGFWSASGDARSHPDTAVPGAHRSLPLERMGLASASCNSDGAERTVGAAAHHRSHPSHPTGTRRPGGGDHHHRQLRAVRSQKGARIVMETTSTQFTLAEQREAQLSKVLEKIYSAAQPGAVYSEPVTAGNYTVITASEIVAGGGFGSGFGFG